MMSDRSLLGATVFEYGTNGFDGNNRELWGEVARDIAAEYPDSYRYDEQRPMSLIVTDSAQPSPADAALIRYRVIRANVLRVSQHTVLIELCLGNCFSESGVDCKSTAEISASRTDVAKWIRSAGMISHSEHIERVRQFILDADDAGWSFPLVEVEQLSTGPLMLVNGQGSHEYRPKIAKALSKIPIKGMNGRQLFIVAPDRGVPAGVIRQLEERLTALPGCSVRTNSPIKTLSPMSPIPDGGLAIVAMPNTINLATSKTWREYLSGLEDSGCLFKLAMQSTLGNRFALDNVCHDLFLLDGGCPWTGEYHLIRDAVAVDAGHDMDNELSLWVSARYMLDNNEVSMRFNTGRLHEDIPTGVFVDVDSLFEGRNGTFFRDGRFHKEEIAELNRRGLAKEDIYYVTKNPGAILFRGSMEDPQLPEFGDSLRFPTGSVLLQSIEPSLNDYERPISLRGATQVSETAVTDVMTLCKQPTLGLFHGSRLPGPIYWADMASKRTIRGWAKAIGRGWGVPHLHP